MSLQQAQHWLWAALRLLFACTQFCCLGNVKMHGTVAQRVIGPLLLMDAPS